MCSKHLSIETEGSFLLIPIWIRISMDDALSGWHSVHVPIIFRSREDRAVAKLTLLAETNLSESYHIPALVTKPLTFFLFPPTKKSACTPRVIKEPHAIN